MVIAIGPIFLWKPSLCLSGRGISGPWTWIRFRGHYCHPQCMSKSATDLVFVKLLFRWSELWYSGFSNLTCTSPSWQNISKLDFTSSKILTFVREATVRRWGWGRGSLRASNPASCLWFALGTIRSLITYGGSVISIETCISLQGAWSRWCYTHWRACRILLPGLCDIDMVLVPVCVTRLRVCSIIWSPCCVRCRTSMLQESSGNHKRWSSLIFSLQGLFPYKPLPHQDPQGVLSSIWRRSIIEISCYCSFWPQTDRQACMNKHSSCFV